MTGVDALALYDKDAWEMDQRLGDDDSPKPIVMSVGEQIAEHLDAIKELFVPTVKLTLAVRTPSMPDRDMIISDDNLLEVIEALARRERREIGTLEAVV